SLGWVSTGGAPALSAPSAARSRGAHGLSARPWRGTRRTIKEVNNGTEPREGRASLPVLQRRNRLRRGGEVRSVSALPQGNAGADADHRAAPPRDRRSSYSVEGSKLSVTSSSSRVYSGKSRRGGLSTWMPASRNLVTSMTS